MYIDDPAFTDDCWKRYNNLLDQLTDKYNTRAPKTTWQQTKERTLSLGKAGQIFLRFVVNDDTGMVAWVVLRVVNPETSRMRAYFNYDSVYDQIPDDFARAIAPAIIAGLGKYGLSVGHFASTSQRKSGLAHLWGATRLNRLVRYVLNRAEANVDLMNKWLDRVPRANSDLRLEFFNPVPEKYIVRHTELFNRFVNEMPTEREVVIPFHMDIDEVRRQAEWRAKNNKSVYTYALFDQDDTMVAHSNAFLDGHDVRDVYQGMTGVDKPYRGRGLSKLLKAVLFMKVGKDFPGNETMTTDMRARNEPIQRVNKQMGYVLESNGDEWEISLDALRQFIDA